MATNANIKDALTFSAPPGGGTRPFAEAKTVGNAQLLRFQNALAASYEFLDSNGDPRTPDADDAAAWLWKQAAAFTRHCERGIVEAAVTQPSDLSE